ncbi:MAG: LruC domain-containing protein [Bacteroides sp.]
MKIKLHNRPYFGVLILLLLTSLSSCMEDLFNEELVQKLYEDAFPVKDIDPNLDWKMTRVVTASVKVNDNNGSEYDILIYDTNPLEESSTATLLCKSEPTTKSDFSTRFDCPSYLNELFICKRDTAHRVVAQMVSIRNNSVSTTFGETASTRTFSTRAGGSLIQPYTPPQSESEILSMAKGAKELRPNSRVKAGEVWKIPKGSIFRNDLDVQSKANNPATIIIQGTWRPGGNIAAIQTGANIVVTSGGRIELPSGSAKNKSLCLNGNSTLTVYPGGYIGGENNQKQGYILMSTGSDGRVNYNAGTIQVSTIDMRGGKSQFYNCGNLDIDELLITDNGGKLTNMGKATIGTTTTNSTIENGCFLRVSGSLCGHLLMDNSCAAVLASYGKADQSNSSKTIRLGHQSMITIEGNAYFAYGTQVQGPDRGEALFRINNLVSINGFSHRGGMVYYEVNKVSVSNEWEKATFMHYLLNSQGTLARWGEAPIRIEPDQCTGEGNKPTEEGKPTPEEPLSYTYVFEDNYPLVGDYDFNDVVIDVVPSYHRERESNRIKRIQLDVTLAAAGASKMLGLGLRLVGIQKNQIASVRSGGADSRFQESLRSKYSLFTFNATSLQEDSDPSVVIPIAGEVHEVFGVDYGQVVNVGSDVKHAVTAKPYTYEIILELNDQTRTDPVITKDNLDFFICYQYKSMPKRMEVHLYEFWKYGATAAGTIQKLNLDLAGNNTWAVCVPYGFRYPKEYVNISRTDTPDECAYPEFINWARDREVCQDWYKHPNEGYVMR